MRAWSGLTNQANRRALAAGVSPRMRDVLGERRVNRHCGGTSVDEFPSVRSIEPSYLNTLLKARIKVVQIDTVLAAWLGDKWLPMRGTSAGLATQIAQSLVSPNVLGRLT